MTAELCRDLFAYDADEGQFECDLPEGHEGRHRVTGQTWESDTQRWIDWEVTWSRSDG